MKYQQGVGLIEVLVALLLLAIGVLGYTALQVKAVDASTEALNRSKAILIMRGLAESMRANIAGQSSYPTAIQSYVNYTSSTSAPNPSCNNSACTAAQMATFNAYQAAKMAFESGMTLTMQTCPGVSTSKRQCLFVAWGNTTLGTGTGATAYSNCMSSTGTYVSGSTCLMMEVY